MSESKEDRVIVVQPRSRLIIQELIQFCQKTSVRGVPRIINRKEKKFKLLWFIFVLGFLIGCITCIVLLILQFLERDVIQQRKTLYKYGPPFPSFTFCNLRPFSSSGISNIMKYKLPTVYKYLDKYLREVHMHLVKESRINDTDRDNISEMLGLNYYLLNLPNSIKAESLTHSLETALMDCAVIIINGTDSMASQCADMGQWEYIYHNLYGRCYMYSVKREISHLVKGVQMSIFLDDNQGIACIDCGMWVFTATQMTGLRLAIHEPNTFPDVDNNGITLHPNTFTDLQFQTQQMIGLEHPYGKCNPTIRGEVHYSLEGASLNYSRVGCLIYQKQRLLYETCNCITLGEVPKYLLPLYKNRQFCSFMPYPMKGFNVTRDFSSHIVQQFLNQSRCEAAHKHKIGTHLCPRPCKYYNYETKISSGIYPVKSFHLEFSKQIKLKLYRNLKVAKNLETKFNIKNILNKLLIYDKIEKLYRNNSKEEALKLLDNTNVIERNFISLNINRQTFNMDSYIEKPVISLTRFLSQIGGILSIWSGISFICIVELIDLVFMIIGVLQTSSKVA